VARKIKSSVQKRERMGLSFVLPFIAIFLLLFVTPLIYSGYLSTWKRTLVGGNTFVGLGNYIKAIHDPKFTAGVLRVLLFFFIQVPVMLLLSITLALIIDSGKLRAVKFYRIIVFLPYAVPAIIGSLIWGYLYGPNYGLLAQIIHPFTTTKIHFLSSTLALPSIGNIVTWEYAGYNMVILYAALKGLSNELYEAAAIDGAGPIRLALSIKLPQLKPAIILTLIFSVIGSFQLFTEPINLMNNAPTVLDGYYTPNIYAYTAAFVSQNLNYAAAISFLLGFVVILTVALISRRGVNK
jgi:multiple sugar transport system permease protein